MILDPWVYHQDAILYFLDKLQYFTDLKCVAIRGQSLTAIHCLVRNSASKACTLAWNPTAGRMTSWTLVWFYMVLGGFIWLTVWFDMVRLRLCVCVVWYDYSFVFVFFKGIRYGMICFFQW